MEEYVGSKQCLLSKCFSDFSDNNMYITRNITSGDAYASSEMRFSSSIVKVNLAR